MYYLRIVAEIYEKVTEQFLQLIYIFIYATAVEYSMLFAFASFLAL